MTEFIINIISELGNHELNVKAVNDVDSLFIEIMSLFEHSNNEEEHKFILESIQKNSISLQTKFIDFAKSNQQFASGIYKVVSLLKSMKIDEYFCVIPSNDTLPQDFVNQITKYLFRNNHEGAEAFEAYLEENYKFILDNYTVFHYDNYKRTNIGESDRNKRTCRYCGQKSPDVTFRKKAHTISESLGNKTIVTNDECDCCNESMGKGIEQQFSDYIAPLRLFYGIQGKNGVPKLKDGDEIFSFEIKNDGEKNQLSIGLYEKDDVNRQKWEMKDGPNFSITHPNKINVQDVYRAIVKYAIGIMGEDDLSNCKKTIDWVRKKVSSNKLPKVLFYIDSYFSSQNTGVTLFRRKNSEDHTIPHYFMELRASGLIILAIIPYTSEYETSFEDGNELKYFIDKLKPYKNIPMLRILDGSVDELRDFKMNFEFHKRTSSSNNN